MIGLPKSTEYGKRIPKQNLHKKMYPPDAVKKSFSEQVKNVYWRNKLAESTINIATGNTVLEIQVFEIKLNSATFEEGILKAIDKVVPYHILYLLEHDGKYQAWIPYKENLNEAKTEFKVGTYYHTDWMTENELPLKIQGLSLDAVYENFVRQIAGSTLHSKTDESLKESVERNEKRKKLEKQIHTLQAKIRKEPQFNKQVEMNDKLKKLKKEWEALEHGKNENGIR